MIYPIVFLSRLILIYQNNKRFILSQRALFCVNSFYFPFMMSFISHIWVETPGLCQWGFTLRRRGRSADRPARFGRYWQQSSRGRILLFKNTNRKCLFSERLCSRSSKSQARLWAYTVPTPCFCMFSCRKQLFSALWNTRNQEISHPRTLDNLLRQQAHENLQLLQHPPLDLQPIKHSTQRAKRTLMYQRFN